MQRTALPGGAPLKPKSKRPCKYGPRDSDGYCPKRPAATTRSKKPCKYGPRGADGYCPKAPKKGAKPKAEVPWYDEPIAAGITPSGKVRKTTVARELDKIVTPAAGKLAEKAVEKAWTEYRKDPARVKGILGSLALGMGKLGLVGATAYAVFKAAMSASRAKEETITRLTFLALNQAKTKLMATGQWRQEYAAKLIPQYQAFFRREMALLNRK